MKKKSLITTNVLTLLALSILLSSCQSESAYIYNVLSLDALPSTVLTGENIYVVADINNLGKNETKYIIPVSVNGKIDDEKVITLASGKSQKVEFVLSMGEAGQYEISVGNKRKLINVENASPADFIISDLNIDTDQASPGEEIVVTARIANVGDSQDIYVAELKINGIVEQSEKLIMPPGSKSNLVFKLIKNDPGKYSISLGDLSDNFTIIKSNTSLDDTLYKRNSQWPQSSCSSGDNHGCQ